MKQKFIGEFNANPRQIMRRLSYGEIFDRRSRQVRYVRRFSHGFYPRFHLYFELVEGGFSISLHLDQKKASYKGHTAHSGEYEGELVEAEMGRISNVIVVKFKKQ